MAGPSRQPEAPPGHEIAARRTRSSKTFATGRWEQFETHTYSGPVHHMDAQGRWLDIDETLVSQGDGRFRSRSTSAPVEVAGAANDPLLASVDLGGGDAVGFALQDAVASPPYVEGNTATFYNVARDTDVVLTARNDGVKEDLILRTKNAPDTFVFPLRLRGVRASMSVGGAIVYKDASGAVRAATPPGFMEDWAFTKSGERVRSEGVAYSLIEKNGMQSLKVTLDRDWLDDPARNYPITVDPSTFWNSTTWSDDTFWQGLRSNNSGDPELRVGWTDGVAGNPESVSYMHFDVGGLDWKTIDSAAFHVWNRHSWSCAARGMGVYPINTATNWVGSNVDLGYLPLRQRVGWAAYAMGYTTCPAGWASYHDQGIKDTVHNWTHGIWNDFGLALKVDPGSETDPFAWKKFDSWQGAAGDPGVVPGAGTIRKGIPQIHIMWSEPAPSAPSNLVPVNGANYASAQPSSASATYTDSRSGSITFRLRSGGAGGAVIADSGAIAASQNQSKSWTLPNNLTNGTYAIEAIASNAGGTATAGPNVFTIGVAPNVTKGFGTVNQNGSIDCTTISTALRTFGRGQRVPWCIRVANPLGGSMTVDRIEDILPAGVTNQSAGTRLGPVPYLNGALCTTCTWDAANPRKLTVGSFSLPGGGFATLAIDTVAVGSDAACSRWGNIATATTASITAYSNGNVAVNIDICDARLGFENWWTYVTRDVGSGGTANVNVANGNLVLIHDDSEPVQARGRLGLGVRRTYNSQDATLATLPGSLGSGWTLNVAEVGELAGDTISASGLLVPAINAAAKPASVTLVDQDGTRHVFSAKSAGVAAAAVATPLQPDSLSPAANTSICIDQSYTSPPGVRLSLWRYVQVNATGTTACDNVDTNPSAVTVGFVTMRPDRLRSEFAATGQLLSVTDGSGAQLRYLYESPAPVGALFPNLRAVFDGSCRTEQNTVPTSIDEIPETCRRIEISHLPTEIQVLDSGHLAPTRYLQSVIGTKSLLTQVVNPDGSTLTYSYGGCAGSTATQLCSVTDARGKQTAFTYAAASSHGQPNGSLPVLRTITDRRGNTTTFTYTASTAVVDQGTHRQQFISIDPSGRVGEVREGGTDNLVLRQSVNTWDTTGATCQATVPATVDHNLCSVERMWLPAGAGSERTSFVYSKEGDVVRESRLVDAAGMTAHSTYGYRTQFISAAATTCLALVPSGAGGGMAQNPTGSNCSATGPTSSTLFTIRDRTHALTPRGNAASGTAYADYMTTYILDNSAGWPNRAVTGSCGAAPAANTGNVCEVKSPAFDPATPSIKTTTRFTYGAFGQKASMTTPKAIAEGAAGSYAYTYYEDGKLDLSGNVSVAGWLKVVTDPTGRFAAFAYDRAGHVVRTWDRNATAGLTTSAAWESDASPPSPSYTETRFGPVAGAPVGATAFSAPWRFVISSRDAIGNLTSFTPDGNGNVVRTRPPRGNAAGNTSFDITQTFDNSDNLATRTLPLGSSDGSVAGVTTWAYDEFDNPIMVTDANGRVSQRQYDNVSRPTTTRWSRSGDALDATTGCPYLTGDAVFPSMVVCSTTTAYNGVDDVTSVQNANGKNSTYTYDRVHRVKRVETPRDGSTMLKSEQVYDLDGNVERICPPRQFAEGLSTSCEAASSTAGQFSTHQIWDVAGRRTSVTSYRASTPQTTEFGYDADGNLARVKDAELHTSTATYDLLDRRRSATVPRAANISHTTTWNYDAAGNVTAVVRPVDEDGFSRVTAYSYDDNNRLVDAVEGADNVDADVAGVPASSSDGGLNTRTRRIYDADGRVVAVYGPRAFVPYGAVTNTKLTPNDAFKVRTDYDVVGRPVAQWVPRYDAISTTLGASSAQSTHCPVGAVGYAANVGVCVTRTQYDAVGNRSRVDMPTIAGDARRFLGFAYTHDNLVSKLFTPSPADDAARVAAMSYRYNGVGQPRTKLNALNLGTTTNYTDDGLVKDVTDSLNHQTSFTYDADGNVKTSIDALLKATTTSYTTDGLVSSVADPLNNTTSYQYDKVGNTTQVVSPNGASTVNTYTWDNLLLTSTEPVDLAAGKTRRTTYGYDNGGRKTRQQVYELIGGATPPAMSCGTAWTSCIKYYRNDRVEKETGRSGGTIITTYDPAGNPVQVADSTNASATLAATYYLDDRVRSVGDGSQVSSFSYDGAGNAAAVVQGTAIGVGKQTQYAYNNAGLQRAMGSEVVFSSADPSTAPSWTWTYDAAGRLITEAPRNGATVSNCWNADDTLKTHVVKTGGPSSAGCPSTDSGVIAHWEYTYDANARTKTQTLSQAAGAGGTAVTVGGRFEYDYDDAGRLTRFVDENGTRSRTIRWDANSNRTEFGITGEFQPQRWDYNADDSIKEGPAAGSGRLAYSYDHAGRLVNDGCMSYGYDGFDRLVLGDSLQSDTDPARAGCKPEGVRYAYDGMDRQRSHTVVPTSGPSRTTTVHYSGLSSSLSAVDAVGNLIPAYRYALDPDGIAKAISLSTTTTAPEYLADDGTGSVTTVTNASGAVTCNARFDPFGSAQKVGAADTWSRTELGRQDVCNTGTTANQVFYKGARHDVGAGTYQFGSRTYDPKKSAFLTPDSYRGPSSAADLSIGTDPLTRNSYTFVNGDPVNLYDPDGHISCPDGYCNWSANPNRKELFRSTDPYNFLRNRVMFHIQYGMQLPNQWHLWDDRKQNKWMFKNVVEPRVKLTANAWDVPAMLEDAAKGHVNGVAGIANAGASLLTLGQVHIEPVYKEERYRASYVVGNVGGYTAAAIGAYGLAGAVESPLGGLATRAYVHVRNSRAVTALGAAGTAVGERITRGREAVGRFIRRGSRDVPQPMDDLTRAAEARDAVGRELGRKHATYVGGARDGRVAVGCSANPTGCAEDDIARKLGPDAQMTKAFGWRRNPATSELEWTEIPVCTACQAKYPANQFPSDVQADPGGRWGR